MKETYLGIDVGGTNTKYCLTDRKLRILDRGVLPTDKSMDIVCFLSELISDMLQKHSDIVWASIGLPGIVDGERGIVHTAPSIMTGERMIQKELQEKSQVPVFLENDVTLWAVSEGEFGACEGMKDYVLIALGTGIGSCIVINGEPYKGYDLAAGEIGYMVFPEDLQRNAKSSNEFGSFEKKVSASAIVNDYNYGVELSIEETFQHFKNQDNEKANQYISQKFDYLSVGIANIITILHPQAVVLAGKITCEWDFLYEGIQPRIDRLIHTQTKLLKSKTGDYGAALGAVLSGFKLSGKN